MSVVCLQPGKYLMEFSKNSQAVPAVTGSGTRSVCKVQGQPHLLLVNKQTKTIDLSFYHDLDIVLESSFHHSPEGYFHLHVYRREG